MSVSIATVREAIFCTMWFITHGRVGVCPCQSAWLPCVSLGIGFILKSPTSVLNFYRKVMWGLAGEVTGIPNRF